MLLKVKRADITMMTSDMTSCVNLDFFAQNRKTKMATGRLCVSLTQPTMVKEQMEPGEETQLNPTDTGSLILMDTLDNGSVMMVRQMVSGPLTMDPLQLELGGSKATALGSELLPLMIPMIPLSTTALITKSTCALILTTVKSTLKITTAVGTGKLMESVIT